ncbi:N-acetylmuramoyl-L-alanine amidase [Paenibacillus endophyticus]|uniref:N-acetylmuramoyl-L-alanine amidase n=1 Tax=Paenibacillus endophyticus TaxID=1294268 RepID=A0A7W5GA00_9BACL|nr:N-acetylmuramoyl-L-alanine amidase [Paenibacillus endophyticus]MBB3151778.1 N-acetylmuramoyl-L-alanine amidase [Paenibacillus endophyticus]
MKRFVSMLLFMSLFFTMFATVGQAAEVVPKLFLNGNLLTSAVNPQIINNATVVPVRTVSEGLGYQIVWDNTTKAATVTHGSNIIKLKLNDNIALVNDQKVQMDTTASVIKGTTLVPLRFIGEQFGLDFEWKATEKEVHMYEHATEPTEPVIPTDPAVPTGLITEVAYNGESTLTVSYEGVSKANKPLVLDSPKRIVFDFPNTGLNTFLSGQAVIDVTDSTYLQKIRYSLFSNSPPTVRLVIEISEDTGYVLTEDLGKFKLTFMPLADVPVDPNLPVDPPIVIDPQEPPASNDMFDVVIDPGHGGSDPGAKSVLNRWEKEFNLSVALKMKALLDKEPKIKAHFTRTGDTYPSLDDRIKFAENLKADLFMSIHANSGAASASGAETYYYRENSKALAAVIHKRLIAATKIKDRGVKKEAYKVIKQTTMPAVLIEAGFLSNSNDAKMLFDDAAQTRIATELVAGIKEYFKVK